MGDWALTVLLVCWWPIWLFMFVLEPFRWSNEFCSFSHSLYQNSQAGPSCSGWTHPNAGSIQPSPNQRIGSSNHSTLPLADRKGGRSQKIGEAVSGFFLCGAKATKITKWTYRVGVRAQFSKTIRSRRRRSQQQQQQRRRRQQRVIAFEERHATDDGGRPGTKNDVWDGRTHGGWERRARDERPMGRKAGDRICVFFRTRPTELTVRGQRRRPPCYSSTKRCGDVATFFVCGGAGRTWWPWPIPFSEMTEFK